MSERPLNSAIASVPAGKWAVGVSGGADSIALLSLLRGRDDLALHVVHLDHELRGAESAADAQFVSELAHKWQLPCTLALRHEVESGMARLPANPSARYRAARLELFRQVVSHNGLKGVILAHHADDQAETILHRLIRGSGPRGLGGMSARAMLGELLMVRPLLNVSREELRDRLSQVEQPWREDPSNASDQYLRNRLRRLLASHSRLRSTLLELGDKCRSLRQWTAEHAPRLPESFAAGQLQELPQVLAQEAARRWLIARGAPPGQISQAVMDRLIEIACDAATAPRQYFPGGLLVCRRRGVIGVER